MRRLNMNHLPKSQNYEILNFLNQRIVGKMKCIIRNRKFHSFIKEYYHRMLSNETLIFKLSINNKQSLQTYMSFLFESNYNINTIFIHCPNKNLDDTDILLISLYITHTTQLRSLNVDLFNNRITNVGLENLSSSISSLKSTLRSLSLSIGYNNITNEGLLSFSSNLVLLDSLQELKLNFLNLEFKAEGMKNITKSCIDLKKLVSLDINLYNNKIGYEGIIYLTQLLSFKKNLRYLSLNLYLCRITNQGLISLADTLSSMSNLEYLYLNIGLNEIENKAIAYLGKGLKKIPSLNILQLIYSYNRIDLEGFLESFKQICIMERLRELYIDCIGNKIASKQYLQTYFKNLSKSMKNLIKFNFLY